MSDRLLLVAQAIVLEATLLLAEREGCVVEIYVEDLATGSTQWKAVTPWLPCEALMVSYGAHITLLPSCICLCSKCHQASKKLLCNGHRNKDWHVSLTGDNRASRGRGSLSRRAMTSSNSFIIQIFIKCQL